MWKDFFYYSRSERRAILFLLVVAILLLGTALFLRWTSDEQVPVVVSDNEEVNTFLAGIREKESKRYFYSPKPEVPVVLRSFDPNTADSSTLRSLGLPDFIVRNILKYRAKGGEFRSAESFSRIYGLKPDLFNTLKPYIVIAAKDWEQQARDTFVHEKDTVLRPLKYKEGTVVELNTADTTVLKRIPGIGSGLAKMIVAYRKRLGGFYDVAQLQEVNHVGIELNKWFRVDSSKLTPIEVNRASLDELRMHPYMNFYKAKAILEYRRKRGKIKGLSQLSMFEEFTEKDLKKMSPYFSFD